ncbi:MAG TPA: hypothetical protein VGM91_22770 [Conexibacter sp.]|jgi:hypothetical protein
MNDLEDAARRSLISMLRGQRRRLAPGEQLAVASWLVKTALVARSQFERSRPEFAARFNEERLPSSSTLVWLASTPTMRHDHTLDVRSIRVHDEDAPEPDEHNAFSATISIGMFAGFVVSWLDNRPPLSRLFPVFEQSLVAIWPMGENAVWPPRDHLYRSGLDRLAETIVVADEMPVEYD